MSKKIKFTKKNQKEYLDKLLDRTLKGLNKQLCKGKHEPNKLFTQEQINNIIIDWYIPNSENVCGCFQIKANPRAKKRILISEDYLYGKDINFNHNGKTITIKGVDNSLDSRLYINNQTYEYNYPIIDIITHELAHYWSFLNLDIYPYTKYFGFNTLQSDNSFFHMVILSKFNVYENNSYVNYNYFKNSELFDFISCLSFSETVEKLKELILLINKQLDSLNGYELLYSYGCEFKFDYDKSYNIALENNSLHPILEFSPNNTINKDIEVKYTFNSEKIVINKIILPTTFWFKFANNLDKTIINFIKKDILSKDLELQRELERKLQTFPF